MRDLTVNITAAMAATFALGTAAAADGGVVALDDRATWTLAIANDSFSGSDDNYTSGFRFGYLSGNDRLDAPGRAIARTFFNVDEPAANFGIRHGWAIAQEVFTPADLDTTAPLPDQHPYAAYLYGEYTALIEQPNSVDQVSVQLGVIGPSALGEQTQNGFHNLIGREEALGWDNQIDDTVGFNVALSRLWRVAKGRSIGGAGWDANLTSGLSLGTVEVSARAGGTLRFGENLAADFGAPRVRPTPAGSTFFVPQDLRSWYFFIGAEVEAVAYNIFLDGSAFRDDDPSVEKKAVVADLQTGVAAQLGRTQLAFTYVARTEEFSTQQELQTFGVVSLSRRF